MFNKLIMLLILCMPVLGYAEQRLVVREGGNVTAHISASDLNRISVQGDRILTIKGNAGQFQLEKDLSLGQIFIQPNSPEDKSPIHVYITTEQGQTYSLTLLSTDMPAENITLVSIDHKPGLASWENTAPYEDMIVKIINSMHNQVSLEGFTLIQDKVKNDYKIRNLAVKAQGHYVGAKLQGQRFQVQNISEHEVTLRESDFYKNGVRAISIIHKRIPPQGKAILYIVRGA